MDKNEIRRIMEENDEEKFNKFVKNRRKKIALDLHESGIEMMPDEVEKLFLDGLEKIKEVVKEKHNMEINNVEAFVMLRELLIKKENK